MSFFQETEIGRREGRKEYAKKMFSWENTVIKMSALRAVLSKSSSSSAASISNLIASVCSKKKKRKKKASGSRQTTCFCYYFATEHSPYEEIAKY